MSAPASIESEAERAAGVDRPNHELWKRARRPRESIDPDASPGTSSVTSMAGTFRGAKAFNQPRAWRDA